MPLLRDNLQPTDFADAVCMVSEWMPFDGVNATAYRVWICRCSNHWFQRHEWAIANANQTNMDDWIYSGHSTQRSFDRHLVPAPNLEEI